MAEQNVTQQVAEPGKQHRIRDLASRLYRGEAGIDVVGKRKIWYGVAGGIVLVAIITFLLQPFNLGIEFRGGNSFTVPATVGTLAEVRAAVEETGAEVATAQTVGGASGESYLIKTDELADDPAAADARGSGDQGRAGRATSTSRPTPISESAVSGAWGAAITQQALIGTAVFLVLVVIYLSLVFREWQMAVAALAALAQNLILTADGLSRWSASRSPRRRSSASSPSSASRSTTSWSSSTRCGRTPGASPATRTGPTARRRTWPSTRP